MGIRDFFRRDRWQKGLSLLLATLIWLAIRAGSGIDSRPLYEAGHERVLSSVPILVLAEAADSGRYAVEPPFAQLRLAGDPALLSKLSLRDIEVYVNLLDAPVHRSARPVHVLAPSGIRVVAVSPSDAVVERLPAGD